MAIVDLVDVDATVADDCLLTKHLRSTMPSGPQEPERDPSAGSDGASRSVSTASVFSSDLCNPTHFAFKMSEGLEKFRKTPSTVTWTVFCVDCLLLPCFQC